MEKSDLPPLVLGTPILYEMQSSTYGRYWVTTRYSGLGSKEVMGATVPSLILRQYVAWDDTVSWGRIEPELHKRGDSLSSIISMVPISEAQYRSLVQLHFDQFEEYFRADTRTYSAIVTNGQTN